MKFNTLRYLILPWFFLFCAIIAVIMVEGTLFHVDESWHQYFFAVLTSGVLLCLIFNFKTLTKAGIWLANSLPRTLIKNPWWSFFRAALALVFAYAIFEVGKLAWVPVIWQGAVIPVVFTICLFVMIWSLMGPVLAFCSRVAFSRASAFFLSWPILALVPITAVFLGNTFVSAYQVSRPDFAFNIRTTTTAEATEEMPAAVPTDEETIPATSKSAVDLQAAVLAGTPCNDKYKLIQSSLIPGGEADTVYWAVRAVKCAEMKSVVGLPKLVDIMMKNTNPLVRAAAIRGMLKFGTVDVKRINYLLVKRMSENEPPPVIEAAATVMLKLGDEDRALVGKKLTALLGSPKTSAVASKLLVSKLKREDVVSEFVAKNLTSTSSNERHRAISMVCSLPEQSRKTIEPHIDVIISAIKTGETSDPAVKALECLGHPGLEALRQELAHPEKLSKEIAARAFAEGAWQDDGAVLETAKACVRDQAVSVRQWCSQALGKVGATAVPEILALLTSKEPQLKTTATNALNYFKDPLAKQELLKVRAQNSGWMANQKNLEVARAIDQALLNMNQTNSKKE